MLREIRIRDLGVIDDATLPFALKLANQGAEAAMAADPHLANGLNGELDLMNEARNCELLAAMFEDRDDIVFPKIFWEWCSERVLVQEFIHGIRPTDEEGLRAAGVDKKLLAQKGTDAFLRMALIEGAFHADPHPGNLLALPGNRIGFIDFGIVGRLSQKRRNQLLILIGAMLKQDADGLMAVLLDWTGATNPDLTKLEGSAQAFVERHSSIPLNLGEVLLAFPMAVALGAAFHLALHPAAATDARPTGTSPPPNPTETS